MLKRKVIVRHSFFFVLLLTFSLSLFLLVSFNLLINPDKDKPYDFVIGCFMAPLCLLGLIYNLRMLFDRKPILILSVEGLETRKTGFRTWEEIRHLHLEVTRQGRSESITLYIKANNSRHEISLDYLDISTERLTKLINYCRLNCMLHPNRTHVTERRSV